MNKVIAHLAQIKISNQELMVVRSFLKGLNNNIKKQQSFFDYCLKWKLAPWIKIQLERNNFFSLFDESIQHQFVIAYEKVLQENVDRNIEAKRFLLEFAKNDVEVIILKGNLFAHTIYEDLGYKKMNDFDILIHPKDWVKVQQIYEKLDFIPLGFGWSGEKQEPASYSHTGIPFISRNFKCIIGTQWGLKSPTTNQNVNLNEAWETALPFVFEGVPCKQLSPQYNLLHLVLHMGIYKCGVRDAMDVFNLMHSYSFDNKELVELFSKSNTVEKARFTLEITSLSSSIISDSLLRNLKLTNNSFLFKRLLRRKKMFEATGEIHSSYNDHFQDIEKNVLYFNIFHKSHKKAPFYFKIISQIFFPSTALVLKFIDKTHEPNLINKLKGRLLAPWFSFALIAQEIGWKFSLILFVKLFIDLLVSPIYYFIPKDSYISFLEKKGIDAKLIKNVVANVQ